MFALINTCKKAPILRCFEITTNIKDLLEDMTYIPVKPTVKSDNYKDFELMFIKELIEMEKQETECRESDGGEMGENSLEFLGEDGYIKYVKERMCTALHGDWTDYYIQLTPISDVKHDAFAHVQFHIPPTIMELFYAHSKIWQDMNRDIDYTDYHYSMMNIRGDSDKLIVTINVSS